MTFFFKLDFYLSHRIKDDETYDGNVGIKVLYSSKMLIHLNQPSLRSPVLDCDQKVKWCMNKNQFKDQLTSTCHVSSDG